LRRRKRSLVQLEQVMACATQLPGNAFDVFSTYNCYGCWCGKGGQGEPVDGIDQCCQTHDRCYDKLTDENTCKFWLGQVYLNSYEFQCKEGDVDLPTATGNTSRLAPVCTKSDSECGAGACACDTAFANCIRQFKMGEKKPCPEKRLVCVADPTSWKDWFDKEQHGWFDKHHWFGHGSSEDQKKL